MRTHLRRAGALLTAVIVMATMLLAGAAAPATAATAPDVFSNPPIPKGAQPAPAPRADTPMTVAVGLSNDRDGLVAFAAAVSDPKSPQYGKYATLAELRRRFGATASTKAAVQDAFAAQGVRVDFDSTGTMAYATGPTSGIGATFGTGIARWRLASGVTFTAPTGTPSLPAALQGKVTAVAGLNSYPLLPHAAVAPSGGNSRINGQPRSNPAWATRTGSPVGCVDAVNTGAFMPNQFNTAYQVDSLVTQGFTGVGRRVAVIDYGEFNPDDFRISANCFGSTASTPSMQVTDPTFSNDPDIGPLMRSETTLDIQSVIVAAKQLSRMDVFVDIYIPRMVANAIDPANTGGVAPDVITSSIDPGCEPSLGAATVQAFDQVLAAAAGTGVSFLQAAGDHGSSNCYNPPGDLDTQLATNWPTSSPFATSVGGTNLLLTNSGPSVNTISATEVWNDTALTPPLAAGGGGYQSSVFGRPTWQNAAGVNLGGTRQVPDVAFYADIKPGWPIYCTVCSPLLASGWSTIGGTSAATPFFAGLIALFAQKAAATGQPRLGMLTPLLYQFANLDYAGAFTDITVGTNDLFSVGCCTAAAGYDRASGLGSVKAQGMDVLLTPPVAALKANRTYGSAGVSVTFDASGSTGTTLLPVQRYEWDFDGDGLVDALTDSPSATFTYNTDGTYAARVAAVNSLGRRGRAAVTISVGSVAFGQAGDVPVPGAYGSQTEQVPAVYRPSTGRWYARGVFDAGVAFGQTGDVPVPLDCDGDGVVEPTVFRPSNGTWYNIACFPGGVQFGVNGDIPIPGTYDPTTTAWKLAVYRPSNRNWYVQTVQPGGAQFGSVGDVPITFRAATGANPVQVPAVYRPSTSTFFVAGVYPAGVQYGLRGDMPVASNFQLSPGWLPAVYRPSTGRWYVKGVYDSGVQFGAVGDKPVPWAPSVISAVPSVFRNGLWYIRA